MKIRCIFYFGCTFVEGFVRDHVMALKSRWHINSSHAGVSTCNLVERYLQKKCDASEGRREQTAQNITHAHVQQKV